MPNLTCKRCKAKLLEEKWGLYWRKDDKCWYCHDCVEQLARENNDRTAS